MAVDGTATRMTPEAVLEERARLDDEDIDAIAGGQIRTNLVQTRLVVEALAPREWEEEAAKLLTLLEHAPIRGASPAYAATRMLYAALASDLRGYAHAAGEPVGIEVDLRAATSQIEERRIRERLADQAAAFDRHEDQVLLAHAAQREVDRAHDQEEPQQPTPAIAAPAEPIDVSNWLG